uniref:Uncharacterized protein n=1 Tax=Rhizophora mucronata TaxID=61149 RepID=A0A2P2NYI5_RHIMU
MWHVCFICRIQKDGYKRQISKTLIQKEAMMHIE